MSPIDEMMRRQVDHWEWMSQCLRLGYHPIRGEMLPLQETLDYANLCAERANYYRQGLNWREFERTVLSMMLKYGRM